MNIQSWLLSAACLALGALVQSVLGFGMGLVAVPLLVLTGVALPVAIGLLMPNVLVQTAFSNWQYRHQLPWRQAGQVYVLRVLALPLGILALRGIAGAGQDLTRQIVGLGLMGLLLLPRSVPRRLPALQGHAAMITAGTLSGFLAGLLGMGGPPLVLWVLGQPWPPLRQRSFLWLSFMLLAPVQTGLLLWTFGWPMARAMGAGLTLAPLVVPIAALGARWGSSLSKERLRWLTRAFLLLLALRLIIGRWIAW